MSIVFQNPEPDARDPRGGPAHRAHRRRRRHLGPRLDDQARRAVHRRRPHRLAGRVRSTRCRSAGITVGSSLDERDDHGLRDRARDERHQLHRRPRRARRRRRAHRERRVLPLHLPARAEDVAAQLLQPRVAHRRRARRRLRRLPAAQLAPGEAVHGRRRRAPHRPAHGDVGDRGHGPDRPGLARHSTSCSPPSSRSSCRSPCSSSRCSTSGSPSSGASGPASRRSAPTASTCTTACSTWATRTCTPC